MLQVMHNFASTLTHLSNFLTDNFFVLLPYFFILFIYLWKTTHVRSTYFVEFLNCEPFQWASFILWIFYKKLPQKWTGKSNRFIICCKNACNKKAKRLFLRRPSIHPSKPCDHVISLPRLLQSEKYNCKFWSHLTSFPAKREIILTVMYLYKTLQNMLSFILLQKIGLTTYLSTFYLPSIFFMIIEYFLAKKCLSLSYLSWSYKWLAKSLDM